MHFHNMNILTRLQYLIETDVYLKIYS